MVKKRKWAGLVMLLAVFVCAACDGRDNVGTEFAEPAEAEENQSGTEQEIIERETERETETEEQETELTIYYSNETADGLEAELVTVTELKPEIIIGYLAKHNIVAIDTKVNTFFIEEDGDRKVIRMDLSEAFGEYINTMGTSGEAVIMTALTNTFLEAYEADSMKLLVDGKVLETGHAVYEEELTHMELTSEGWD